METGSEDSRPEQEQEASGPSYMTSAIHYSQFQERRILLLRAASVKNILSHASDYLCVLPISAASSLDCTHYHDLLAQLIHQGPGCNYNKEHIGTYYHISSRAQ